MTPLERGVRDFIIEWNRRRWERGDDVVLEASSYWGVLELVRQSVPEAAEVERESLKAALRTVGYTVQAVSGRTYRLM